mgnify:CR=1 FL=1
MQQSLLDFFSDDPKERIIARLRILAREILGDKARIEKISICRNCSRYAIVHSFVEIARKRIVVYPAGDRLEDGMHQEVYYPKKISRISLIFRIDGNKVVWVKNGKKFYGDLCPECFNKMKEKLVRDAVPIAYKLLLDAKINTPPFESYWSNRKFIVKLPRKKYSFASEAELRETIERKIHSLLYENLGKIESLRDIVDSFKREIDSGNWRILELLVLIRCLDMRRKTKNIRSFDDVVSLVAYVEKRNIKDLLFELNKNGIFLSVDDTVGFTTEEKERLKEFKRIFPTYNNGVFRYQNILWRLPKVYLRYLPPLGFWIGEHSILRIKTKYCIMYIAPSQKIQ